MLLLLLLLMKWEHMKLVIENLWKCMLQHWLCSCSFSLWLPMMSSVCLTASAFFGMPGAVFYLSLSLYYFKPYYFQYRRFDNANIFSSQQLLSKFFSVYCIASDTFRVQYVSNGRKVGTFSNLPLLRAERCCAYYSTAVASKRVSSRCLEALMSVTIMLPPSL